MAGIAEIDSAHESRSLVRRQQRAPNALKSASWLKPGRQEGQTREMGTGNWRPDLVWSALQRLPQGTNGTTRAMRLKQDHLQPPRLNEQHDTPNRVAEATQVRSDQIEKQTDTQKGAQARNTETGQPVRNTIKSGDRPISERR